MKKQLCVLFTSLLILSCSTERPAETKEEHTVVHPVVRELQQKYAPDKRTAIFAISLIDAGKYLIAKGEVDNADAKRELIEKLNAEGKEVHDSVDVLPAENLGAKTWGIITVSVANMRSEPRESAELATQALMGTLVKIWKRKGGYLYIQTPDNYLGWADADQLQRVTEQEGREWNESKKVFVTSLFEIVRQQPSQNSYPVCDMTGGGVLKYLGMQNGWIKVGIADGRTGFLPSSSAIDYNDWGTKVKPVPDNIEKIGKFMMGVPYLWGGTSVKGVDCSGFTKTVFLLNGMMLNRDANQQAEQGVEVEPGKHFENLKKGDLLFFGQKTENGKPERIVHVGIYLGNKEYIHSSGRVHISSFDPASPLFNEYNFNRFVKAKRVIASVPQVAEVKTK